MRRGEVPLMSIECQGSLTISTTEKSNAHHGFLTGSVNVHEGPNGILLLDAYYDDSSVTQILRVNTKIHTHRPRLLGLDTTVSVSGLETPPEIGNEIDWAQFVLLGGVTLSVINTAPAPQTISRR